LMLFSLARAETRGLGGGFGVEEAGARRLGGIVEGAGGLMHKQWSPDRYSEAIE